MEAIGFKMIKMNEAKLLPMHIITHPELFTFVTDYPLHLMFEVVKPTTKINVKSITKATSWTPFKKNHPKVTINAPMARDIASELEDFVIATFNKCTSEEKYEPTDEDISHLTKVTNFASTLRLQG